MKSFRDALLIGIVISPVVTGSGAQAQTAGSPTQTLVMPARPDAARVTLDSKTTALLLLDFVEPICNPQPSCKDQMTPAMTSFIERARKAGVTLAYGTRQECMAKWLKEVAPVAGDIQVAAMAQDRFYNTDLEKALNAKGVKTLILAGWKVSGSVTYTAVGAMLRGYTVVVPVDTTSAATGYETAVGFYNVLNSGTANLANEALKPKAVTLSRTDLITLQ